MSWYYDVEMPDLEQQQLRVASYDELILKQHPQYPEEMCEVYITHEGQAHVLPECNWIDGHLIGVVGRTRYEAAFEAFCAVTKKHFGDGFNYHEC